MKRPRKKWWRRRRVWLLAALLAVLGGTYAYNTRPARLRREVRRALSILRYTDCRIGEISFTPWSGLELHDLELALTRESPLFDATAPSGPPPLRVAYARVRCDMWALLRGRVRPREFVLRDAEIAVVRDMTNGASNWQFLAPDSALGRDGPSKMSSDVQLTLSNADVRLWAVEQGRLRLVRRWMLDVRGSIHASETGPELTLRLENSSPAVAGPVDEADPEGKVLAELRWTAAAGSPTTPSEPGDGAESRERSHVARGRLEARLHWVDVQTVSLLVPQALASAFADFNLTGQARIDRLVLSGDVIEDARIRFADFGLTIPVEADLPDGRPFPNADRFLRLTDASGELVVESGRPTLTVSGRMNGSATRLTFAARPAAGDDATKPGVAGLQAIGSWPFEAELAIDEFEFPNYEERLAFVKSERLPRAVQQFFDNYRPRGRCNVRMRIVRNPRADGPKDGASVPVVSGSIEPLGASCRYFRFPYEVYDVHGFFRFIEGALVFDGLHGRHGSARIRADGRIEHTKPWAAIDLTVRGESVPLDAELYAALPASFRRLWQQAAPIGLVNIETRIRRDEGTPASGRLPVRVTVDTELLGGSVAAGEVRRLTGATGRISIADRVVTVHDLQGFLGSAQAKLAGTITGGQEAGGPLVDLRVDIADIAFAREATLPAFLSAPSEPASEVASSDHSNPERSAVISLRGVADVIGHVQDAEGLGGGQYSVHIKDGVLSGFDAQNPWPNVRGWIVMGGTEQRIVSFAAGRDDAWLEVSGTLPDRLDPNKPISLSIRSGHSAMDELLRSIVPPRWARSSDALGLSGEGWLSVELRPAAGQPSSQAVEVRLESARLKPGPLPLDLRDARLHATIDSAGFELHQADAEYGESGRIHMSGRGGWSKESRWFDLTVTARDLQWSDEFIAAMPPALAGLLRGLSPQGRFDATLDRIRLVEDGGRTWEVTGGIAFRDAQLKLGLPLTEFAGDLDGVCTVFPDGQIEVDGKFFVRKGLFAGRPVERFEGLLTRGRGERWVTLRDVRGRICDGEVIAQSVRIDPQTGEYELALTLHNLSLDQFLKRGGSQDKVMRRGRLDGQVVLRGKAGDNASRSGDGRLRIRGASLLGSPVLRPVFEFRRKTNRTISDAIDRADVRFVWQGDELKLLRVDIQSRDLRLVGEGRWNLRDNTIDLTLLGAHPSHLARIPLLTDIVDLARAELVQYRVRGTIDAPRVTAEPLHSLTDPIRKLLRGGE